MLRGMLLLNSLDEVEVVHVKVEDYAVRKDVGKVRHQTEGREGVEGAQVAQEHQGSQEGEEEDSPAHVAEGVCVRVWLIVGVGWGWGGVEVGLILTLRELAVCCGGSRK